LAFIEDCDKIQDLKDVVGWKLDLTDDLDRAQLVVCRPPQIKASIEETVNDHSILMNGKIVMLAKRQMKMFIFPTLNGETIQTTLPIKHYRNGKARMNKCVTSFYGDISLKTAGKVDAYEAVAKHFKEKAYEKVSFIIK